MKVMAFADSVLNLFDLFLRIKTAMQDTLKSNPDLLGVVLTGGQSVRMQSDKGLLQTGNEFWAKKAAVLLQRFCTKVVISAGKHQPDYVEILPEFPIVFDTENLPVKGPLKGIMSAHLQYPDINLMVLACDMPKMQSAPLEVLFDFSKEHPWFDAYVFKNPEGEPEPLCAIYRANSISAILAAYRKNPPLKYSMKYFLEQVEVLYIPIEPDWLPCFTNYNTPHDLHQLS